MKDSEEDQEVKTNPGVGDTEPKQSKVLRKSL